MSIKPNGRGSGGAPDGYGLLLLLTTMNVFNFVDRQLLSSFANFIVPDLGLTNTQFGLLTGLMFIVFYAVAGLFMGALADLTHRPRLIASAMLVWSALTAASGLARGFFSLAVPRAFIGVGESALTPTAMSLLADSFPAHRLGFAAGVYYMGVPLGVGISLLVAGALGPAIGWRNCFLLLGAAGAVFSLLVFLVREPRDTKHRAGNGELPKVRQLLAVFLRVLAGSRPLQLTIAGGVFVHFLLGAAVFDQLWLVRERGFDRAEIAVISGVVAVFAGAAGNLFGGLASDRWLRVTGQSRAMFMVWLLIALLPLNLGYRLAPAENVFFWIGIATLYFQLGAFYGPTFSTVQELCPPEVRSTVVAFYIMALNVVGLGIGITGSGIMVDGLIAGGVAQPYTWMFLAFTSATAFAIPCYWFAARTSAARMDVVNA